MALTRAHFRLVQAECCHILLCWVNPRLPTHCPECGKLIYPQVKSWVVWQDEQATIRHKQMED